MLSTFIRVDECRVNRGTRCSPGVSLRNTPSRSELTKAAGTARFTVSGLYELLYHIFVTHQAIHEISFSEPKFPKMPAENFVITNLVLCDAVDRNVENFGEIRALTCLGPVTRPLKARDGVGASVTCEVVTCSMILSFL